MQSQVFFIFCSNGTLIGSGIIGENGKNRIEKKFPVRFLYYLVISGGNNTLFSTV